MTICSRCNREIRHGEPGEEIHPTPQPFHVRCPEPEIGEHVCRLDVFTGGEVVARASCRCGWHGADHSTRTAARRDFEAHLIPMREQVAEIIGALISPHSHDHFTGWRSEAERDVYKAADEILAILTA